MICMLGTVIWWLFSYGPLSLGNYVVADIQKSVKHSELFSRDKLVESSETINFQGDGQMTGTFQLRPEEITVIMKDKIPIICVKNQECENDGNGVYSLTNRGNNTFSSLIIYEETSQITWTVTYY